MKSFSIHIRMYIVRGLIAIIPLLLCVFAVQLLYALIDKRVMGFLAKFFDVRLIPGVGILLVLVSLYLLGVVISNVLGRQIFKLLEGITERIPFIKSIYAVGKQLSHSLSVTDEDKKAFKKVVLINLYSDKILTPAFVMGSVTNRNTEEELYKIFIPTVPNPTSGFLFLIRASQTMDPGWTVEEGLKMVMSAGIISPNQINKSIS